MTIPEIQNLSDEELRVKCAEVRGWIILPISVNEPNDDVACFPPDVEPTDENVWRFAGSDIPDYVKDLNACLEFEVILISEPEPEKGQIGRGSSHLEAYQYALCALEPDKPLWHKSARTKAVAFVFAMQE